MHRSLLLLTPLILGALAGPAWASEDVKLEDTTAQVSYGLGYQMGQDLKRQGVSLEREALVRGLRDGQADKEPLVPAEQIRTMLAELKKRIVADMAKKRQAEAEARKQAGVEFLKQNKARPGVKTTESGLQYRVVTAGTGKQPGPTDKVRVHYRGRTVEGREFDSSHRRGKPAEFALNGVIKGWSEGLQLMQEGAKFELYVPAELAYGGQGKLAHQTLIFEVELLAVGDGAKAAKAEQ